MKTRLFIFLSALIPSSIFIFYSAVTLPSPEWIFFETVLNGDFFYLYGDVLKEKFPFISIEGRFQPFVGLAQNLALIFSEKPAESSIFIVQALLAIIFLIVLENILRKFNEDSRINASIVILFGLSPAFIFSFYHPMLTESVTLILLALLFYFSINYIENGKLLNLLITAILSIAVTFAKVSAGFILLAFFASLVAHKLYFSTLNKRILILGSFSLIISSASLVWLVSNTGAPPDLPVNFYESLNYYIETDAILVVIVLFTVFKLFNDTYKKNIQPKEALINSLLLSGCVYFILLVIYGKHSEYQQVISYLCSSVLLIAVFKSFTQEPISNVRRNALKSYLVPTLIITMSFVLTRKFIPFLFFSIIVTAYLLWASVKKGEQSKKVFFTSLLALFSIMLLLQYKYGTTASYTPHFIRWVFFSSLIIYFYNQFASNDLKVSLSSFKKSGIIFYIFSYILLPGIGLHLWHKVNSINLIQAQSVISNIAKENKETYLLNSTTIQGCHTSLMFDYILNTRLTHINVKDLFYVKNPIYTDDECSRAQNDFNATYAAVPHNFLYDKNHPLELVLLKKQEAKLSVADNLRKNTAIDPSRYVIIYSGDGALVWEYFSRFSPYVSDYKYPGEPTLYLLQKIHYTQ